MAEEKSGFLGGFLSSAIGGIAGIGQGLIQRRTDRINAERNFDQNRKMAEYQYSKDLEMWNRANEYNTPAAQMARYQSAGLNPNLIYGSGSASAGNTSTTIPKYQAPTYRQDYKPLFDFTSVISDYQNFNLRQAQTDNLREQAKISAAEAGIRELKRAYEVAVIGDKVYKMNKEAKKAGVDYDIAEYNKLMWPVMNQLERNLKETQIGRISQDALRIQTDNALKVLQLGWMKKLGVTGLGGIINAVGNIGRMFR